MGVLNKVKYFLPETAMYQLYCTLILPYLNYGILRWERAYKKHVDEISKVQKRAMRSISNSSYLFHTKPLSKKWNPSYVRYVQEHKQLCIFI